MTLERSFMPWLVKYFVGIWAISFVLWNYNATEPVFKKIKKYDDYKKGKENEDGFMDDCKKKFRKCLPKPFLYCLNLSVILFSSSYYVIDYVFDYQSFQQMASPEYKLIAYYAITI